MKNQTRKEYADRFFCSYDNGSLEVLFSTLVDDAKALRIKINACKDEAKRRGITLRKLTKRE